MIERTRLWVRLLCAAILALIFFTIVKTGSRLGAVGFFAAVIAYGGLWGIRRWQTDRNSLFGPAITLAYPVAAGLFLAATFVSGRLHGLVWGYQNSIHSTQARIEQVNRGLPMVLTHPLGYGVAQSGQVLGFTNLDGVITIDVYPLRLVLEYGIIGLFAFYAMFITGIAYGVRTVMRTRDRDVEMLLPFSVALIAFIVIKTVYSSEANHAIPFAMLGAVCVLVARYRKSLQSPPVPADLRR